MLLLLDLIGEIQVQTFKLEEAIASFHRAYQLGDRSALPRSLRTRGWSVSWADFELYSSYIEKSLNRCLRNISECEVDSSGGIEYADVEGAAHAVMASINPNAATALHPIPSEDIAPLWTSSTSSGKGGRRLKVGLMSSDFGVHPVSSLVRGLIQLIDAGRVELYCLSLTSKMSWWGQNITNAVEHFVELTGLNFEDAAMEVASLGIEVLIDLNGHTLHGGLSIMAYHPSPLQMTFLGLPTSTGAAFIDYFLADPVAVPPEHCHHYSERLLLLPHCYIVNDYALLQGDVLKFTDKYRAPRAALNTSSTEDMSSATKLIATLSNSMKMDPDIFAVWTNILRRTPGTRMAIMEYQGHEVYMQHLFAHSAYRGVRQQRLVRTHQTAWIDHLYAKTGLDLILDTRVKNGHTTGLDGVWAGVPTITLAGGSSSEARAGESIARGLGSPFGLTYSLKEYEDLAVSYLQQGSPPGREPPASSLLKRRVQVAGEQEVDLDPLSVLRRFVEQRRSRAPLFHTQLWATSFTRYLQAAWELLHISRTPNAAAAFNTTPNEGRAPDFQKYNRKQLFHLFSNFMDDDDAAAAPRPSDSIIGENDTSSFLARQEYPLEGSLIAAANRAWEASEGLDPLICSEFNKGKTTTTTNDSPVKLNAPHILGKKSPTSSNTEQQPQPPKGDRARRQQQENCPCRDGLQDGTHDDCSSSCTHLYPPIPDYVFDGRLISLNIGESSWCCLMTA